MLKDLMWRLLTGMALGWGTGYWFAHVLFSEEKGKRKIIQRLVFIIYLVCLIHWMTIPPFWHNY